MKITVDFFMGVIMEVKGSKSNLNKLKKAGVLTPTGKVKKEYKGSVSFDENGNIQLDGRISLAKDLKKTKEKKSMVKEKSAKEEKAKETKTGSVKKASSLTSKTTIKPAKEEDSDKFIKYYKGYEIRFDAIQNCYFALKDDDVHFSNEDISYLENEIDDWISWNHPPKIFSCDCVFCRNGTCKNDENPYNYDENCPGDCDYFYRK